MSANTVEFKIRLNYYTVLIAVLFMHGLFLMTRQLPRMTAFTPPRPRRDAIKVSNIKFDSFEKVRTVGAKDAKSKNSTYLQKTASKTKEISKDVYAPAKNTASQTLPSKNETPVKGPKDISLKDLSMGKQQTAQEMRKASPKSAPVAQTLSPRPGTRPVAGAESKKAIQAIALNGSQMKQFVQGSSAAALSGDPRAQSLSNSDILVNLEVPEGVNPDELNKYELMFYGFQRRTAIGYINSFYKKLDKFQAENPHLQFPMTETKQEMTGRLTFDEKGNLKQIKMVRLSDERRLQGFFEEVLKDMDTLHNPPQALWKKDGEFSIFFSLVING